MTEQWTEKKLREAVARELCKLDGISWDELDGEAEATIESVGIREDYYLKADGMLLLIKSATYLKGNKELPTMPYGRASVLNPVQQNYSNKFRKQGYVKAQQEVLKAGFKSTEEWDE